MMKILFDIEAKEQLREIFIYSKENYGLRHAHQYIASIRNKIDSLKTFPLQGNIEWQLTTADHEYRYLLQKPYKIIYSIKDKTIRIHLFWHSRRNPSTMSTATFGVCEPSIP